MIERLARWVLGRLRLDGALLVELPGGGRLVVGSGRQQASLRFHDRRAIREVLGRGLLGFAEAYMAGRIDTDDLAGLMRWAAANTDAWFESLPARMLSPLRRVWNRVRPERRHHRVETMVDHYNLGNEFYESWLDETVTYSSARFATPGQSLADAQRNKYDALATQLGLGPGTRVLEIGCGWGGFAVHAAEHYGCDVVGVTIAQEQAEFARKRVAEAGLADRIDIRLEDFRDVTGEFDAVVSFEMIESVDETVWPPLFAAMRDRLHPGGMAGMQSILISDELWEGYRSRTDFIQRYIFPGGQLPAPKVIEQLAEDHGLRVESIETFPLDYARTLAIWHERFEAAWPDLEGRGGLDERFRRMWKLYLTACEAGFRSGRVDVAQWVFSRS